MYIKDGMTCCDSLQLEAKGQLYVDDGHSYDYKKKGAYLLRTFTFSNNELSSR